MAVLRGAFGIVVCLLASDALSQPLDVSDPTPRPIHLAFEDSVDPGVVGASFGPELAAFYSEQAGIGTISIPVSSHEAARSGGSTAVPGSFTPVVIEVDLGSLEATSQPASGAVELFPGTGFSFTQHALGTTTVAGYVTNSGGFGCASQADVDLACAYFGIWCGETCVIVPGAPYDPVTGKINLVGFETQMGCDGAFCSESFPFAKFGDLRLSEGPPLVPALPSAGTFALLAALLVAGVLGVRR